MDLQQKIDRLEQLLAMDPADHTGFFMLGKLHLDAGQVEKAIAAYEKCLALKPDYTAAWRFLGDCHRRMGNTGQARDVYRRGIAVAEQTRDLQTMKEMQAFLRKLEEE